jgi:DNA-binding CsgD family transcriptional regulator
MRKITLSLAILLVVHDLPAQKLLGLPKIINYSKQSYQAGSQNWDIAQDHSGILYFANNEGLLTFDGSYWRIHQMPNRTGVRSISVSGDRIYVGGQNELGFFTPNKRGELVYTSLVPLLPKNDRSFADVWNICFYRKDIFFRSSNKIMRLNGNRFRVYSNEDWRFLGVSSKLLIAQDHDNKIVVFNGNGWSPTFDQSLLPKDFLITSTIPYNGDTSLVTTLKNGVYLHKGNALLPLPTTIPNAITSKNIYKSLKVAPNQILLATSLGGCYVIDKNGRMLQSFSTFEGLQNNNVRNVYLDKNKNLWLGLDNGIDFLAYNNAITQISPNMQNEGDGYAAIVHDGTLYIGTSTGLYATALDTSTNISLSKSSFKLVPGTEGQVWNLSEVNGVLFMGHHEGSFVINKGVAFRFDNFSGFWNFFPFNNGSPLMVAGNYKGVNFYDFENGRFINNNGKAHFESSRIIAIEGKDIWVAHPYKGVYKVNYAKGSNPLITSYSNRGLPSANHSFVYKIRNKIVVPSAKGFFEYNQEKDSFQPSNFLHKLLGNLDVIYMKEDKNGNIWFVSNKKVGVLDFGGKEPRIIYISELNGRLVNHFEFIYPLNNRNVLIGGEKGFYHIDYEKYRSNNNRIEVMIRTVKAFGETEKLIFGGYYTSNNGASPQQQRQPNLQYKFNSLHFEFSSLLFGQQSNLEYSYLLKGFDRNWSGWAKKAEKEYTNLSPGTYTFKVKARNNLGNESAPQEYTFTILPPWYQTMVAKIFYLFIALIAVAGLYRYQKKKFKEQQLKHEEEQRKLQYLHQLEMEKTEKELIKLRNEKLEAEILNKNNELASASMHLVQKTDVLLKIKEQMIKLKDTPTIGKGDDLKKILRTINDENKMEEQWQHFSLHFDAVHNNFLTRLKKNYPGLSPNDHKLCAYLKMNLTTKEIAQLMNISVRGVEISRYRLRKKLEVPSGVQLFSFLERVEV